MSKHRPLSQSSDMVWRMSEATPMGEWVDKSIEKQRTAARKTESGPTGSWRTSSYDLLEGSEAVEIPADTISGDLFDELFAPATDGHGHTSHLDQNHLE